MTTPYHSLYFHTPDRDALADLLRGGLTASGYTLFDPFGRFPGKSYAQALRLFVAPAAGDWTRVIVGADAAGIAAPAFTALLADAPLCLSVALEANRGTLQVYTQGAAVEPLAALASCLRPGIPAEALARAWQAGAAPIVSSAGSSGGTVGGVPLDALPASVRQMAGGVNPKRAEALFNRMAKQVLRGGEEAQAARALVSGEGAPDWDSPDGKRLRAVLACLTVPDNWREPDFTTVRDAYQLHLRRQRKPNAPLYPGDAETMALLPNALDYVPVYAGKDAS